jgi:phage tail sheath protein FI
MTYKKGINIVTGFGANPIVGVSTAISGIQGIFEKGPMNVPTLATSMADFESAFGAVIAESTIWHAVKSFFAKVGSGQLYINRVAASAAAQSTVSFNDQQGVPESTLKVSGKTKGTWGDNIAVDVDFDSILTTALNGDISVSDEEAVLVSTEGIEVGSFVWFDDATDEYVTVTQVDHANKIIYWSGGLTSGHLDACITKTCEFKLSVYWKGVLVETWAGLSMNDNVTFFCEKIVAENSNYIVVEDLDSSATDYLMQPDVTASASALTSGNDGLSSIAATDYTGNEGNKTGFYAFDAIEGLFRFACPDPYIDSGTEADIITIYQAGIDYAESRGLMQFYCDVPITKTPTTAITFADNFASRQMTVFYPHLIASYNSLLVEFPASCAVMGAAVKKDFERGVHVSVGNRTIGYATDLELKVSDGEDETLNDAGVNTIRIFTGEGIKIWGGRTKTTLTSWRFLNWSEFFNFVGRSLRTSLRDLAFEVHNEAMWKTTLRRVNAFMDRQLTIGAITEYLTVMDSTNNPQDQVAEGIAMLDLEYVPSGVAEKVVIRITNSPAGLTINAA